ncbi:MAG: FeS-binding protein, partial [Salinimicrobium sediminis]|nr:FeS-binding protein [Salinimicrobium sediminis]
MSTAHNNMSLTGEPSAKLSTTQKVATGIGWTGLFILVLALFNLQLPSIFLWSAIILIAVGVILFANDLYIGRSQGIKNDG